MGFQDPREDFGAFYEATYPVAYRVAYGIVGEHALAEDATQDAYLAAFRKRHSYRADGPAEAWLYRIVVNTALSSLRRQHVRSIRPLEPSNLDDPASPDAAAAAVDHLVLMDGLQRLDPIARAAVILRYYLDLDYESIASIIGQSTSNVGSILSRSRDRLHQAISPDRPTHRMAAAEPLGAGRHG
jgi:RNA polymerase sigma-70 factor (ECF subfamily)